MKIEISLLTGLLLVGTDLLVRATAQGFEQAVVALAIEYGTRIIRAGRQILPADIRWGW